MSGLFAELRLINLSIFACKYAQSQSQAVTDFGRIVFSANLEIAFVVTRISIKFKLFLESVG